MKRFNPRGLTTNCGFCAISYALHQQNPVAPIVNADELYDKTLANLRIPKGQYDPLPRLLLFPEPTWDKLRPRPGYELLWENARCPSSYVIGNVATSFGLKTSSMPEIGAWFSTRQSIDEFIEARIERRDPPDPDRVEQALRNLWTGDYIVGSKSASHFLNLRIDGRNGTFEFIDVQKNDISKSVNVAAQLNTIDLALKVTY